MRYLLYLFLVFNCQGLYSQVTEVDSLKKVIAKAADDTNKVYNLNRLTWILKSTGEFSDALKYVEKAKELSIKLNYVRGLIGAHGNQGVIELYKGNYPKALECQLNALKVAEELDSKKDIANAYSNIGNIYWHQRDLDKALDYQLKSLKLREGALYSTKAGNDRAVANSLSNIGNIYYEMEKPDIALEYQLRALALMRSAGDKEGEANALTNIGNAYGSKNETAKALKCFTDALHIYEEMENKSNVAISYFNMADVYFVDKDYKQAERYQLKSLDIATEINDLEGVRDANEGLYETYQATGVYDKAFDHYKKFISARDSLQNEENTKATVRLEMNYEFEKKEAAAKLEEEKKEAIALAESKKQQAVIWTICGVLLLVLGFGIFVYRSYLQKQKANIEVTKQKHIIEEKQKEILDSIHYAKRIQTALITSEKYIERNLDKLIDHKS